MSEYRIINIYFDAYNWIWIFSIIIFYTITTLNIFVVTFIIFPLKKKSCIIFKTIMSILNYFCNVVKIQIKMTT